MKMEWDKSEVIVMVLLMLVMLVMLIMIGGLVLVSEYGIEILKF